MAVFADSNELHSVMLELWDSIIKDRSISSILSKSRLCVQFHYREPDGLITVDGTDGETVKAYAGPTNIKPAVEMFMKSDVAHEFWMGRLNVPVAIIAGKIVAKGPVNKALTLIPAIKPAFHLYQGIMAKRSAKHSADNVHTEKHS